MAHLTRPAEISGVSAGSFPETAAGNRAYVRDHARRISEPHNATAATCGAMLNVLIFPMTNITVYQELTISGTVMLVLLNGFQTPSFLIQPGIRLIIRKLNEPYL